MKNKKLKENLRKPISELREGFETMQFYKISKDGKTQHYRFYFKGSVAVFIAKSRTPHEIDGVKGFLRDIWREKGIICYDAFERFDGVMFFLGESENQIVDKSQRNLEAIRANRFN